LSSSNSFYNFSLAILSSSNFFCSSDIYVLPVNPVNYVWFTPTWDTDIKISSSFFYSSCLTSSAGSSFNFIIISSNYSLSSDFSSLRIYCYWFCWSNFLKILTLEYWVLLVSALLFKDYSATLFYENTDFRIGLAAIYFLLAVSNISLNLYTFPLLKTLLQSPLLEWISFYE
jgi:hypothetical protein